MAFGDLSSGSVLVGMTTSSPPLQHDPIKRVGPRDRLSRFQISPSRHALRPTTNPPNRPPPRQPLAEGGRQAKHWCKPGPGLRCARDGVMIPPKTYNDMATPLTS